MDMLTLYGVTPGEYSHRKNESQGEYIDRFMRDAPNILIISEGNATVVAAVFEDTFDNVQTLIDSSPLLRAAQEKGVVIRETRESMGRDAALAIKEHALLKLKEEHGRITHSDDWPEDPELFHGELLEILPEALRDYNGSVIQMSEPLSATIEEIDSVIASSEKLQRLQKICMTKDEAAAEANFAEKAATGPAAGAHKFLSNRQPERYGDKSTVDYRNVGFDVPPSGPPPNALRVKKEKE
jgi:hypothetical protein